MCNLNDSLKNTKCCSHFNICGGCSYQDIDYDKELELKKYFVLQLFSNAEIAIEPSVEILPNPNVKYYRNKMEFSFGDNGIGTELTLGMRKRRSFYEVESLHDCNIADSDFMEILQAVQIYFRQKKTPFYHKRKHEGTLRHLVVRKSSATGEILVNLVTTSYYDNDNLEFINTLLNLNLKGTIAGILHTINDTLGDVVKSDKTQLLYGRDYINESLLGLNFKISPFSFFQTNSKGAEVLYSTVRDFAGDTTNNLIFDLYCGTGTITQILSQQAEKVVGIEIVEESVNSAIENATINNLNNCSFITGDVLKEISKLNDSPNIIVVDPPREGVNPKALKKIIAYNPPKIIYISCNPKTLVRDIISLAEHGYTMEKIKIIDMFSRTLHVETIVLLQKQELKSLSE